VDIYVDNPLLTRQEAFIHAGFNKMLIQRAISNPFRIKELNINPL
jgi:hypothetical protein